MHISRIDIKSINDQIWAKKLTKTFEKLFVRDQQQIVFIALKN